MSVKKNIAANVVGSGWSALMSIAFVPLYVKYLGIEAYGLIGVFSILLGWLALLDMGMTPTISREMARFSGKAHTNQSILDLLRSVEVIAIVLAILIFFWVYIFSEWLASTWINSDTIEKSVIINAIIIMGFVAALKFVENIYKSAIIGLQKQIQLNVMVVVFATLRGFGAVGVLVYYSPTIEAFFVWQGLVSILTIIVFGVYLYSALPKSEAKVKFSWHELNKIKKYAAGVTTIVFLSILLMNIDKMLLVKILTLSEYGYYTIAFLFSNVLYMIVTAFGQAFFPKFTELKAKEDKVALVDMYHKSSQLITVSVGVIVGYLIFFSEAIVLAWTQDVLLSQEVSPLVSVLSLGTFLNILMWMPYQMQLAYGWTSLTVKINMVAVLFIVPAIFIVVPTYGAIGAAWVWVVLNAGYVFVGVHFMYRKILVDEKWNWYINDIFKPIFVCFGLIGLLKVFLHHENIYMMLAMIVLSMIVVFAGTIASAPLVRMQVLNLIKKRLTK